MDISQVTTLAGMAVDQQIQNKVSQNGQSFQKVLDQIAKSEEKEKDKLLKACQDFEAYFVYQMFKEMDKTVSDAGLVPKGKGEEMFKNMMYQEVANTVASGKGMGISKMMYEQVSRTYAAQIKPEK